MNIENAFLTFNKPTQTEECNFRLPDASSINANTDDMVTPEYQVEVSLASGRSWRRIWDHSYYNKVNLSRKQWTFFPSTFFVFPFYDVIEKL